MQMNFEGQNIIKCLPVAQINRGTPVSWIASFTSLDTVAIGESIKTRAVGHGSRKCAVMTQDCGKLWDVEKYAAFVQCPILKQRGSHTLNRIKDNW